MWSGVMHRIDSGSDGLISDTPIGLLKSAPDDLKAFQMNTSCTVIGEASGAFHAEVCTEFSAPGRTRP